jgi:hypothetical protein
MSDYATNTTNFPAEQNYVRFQIVLPIGIVYEDIYTL